MPNINYSVIGILAIIIHMIINYRYYVRKDNRQEIKDYKSYLTVISLYYLCDASWGFCYAGSNHTLLYCITVLYYITMAFSVVLCCRYIITFLKLNNLLGRVINAAGLVFGFGEIIVLFINHFNHIFFWFDEDGSYHAFALRHAALVVQIVLFTFISVTSFVVSLRTHGFERSRNNTICLFGLMMTLALVAQSLFPLLPLYSMGLMLGTLIVHVFIHNEEKNSQLRRIKELNDTLQSEQKKIQKQKDELSTALGVINALSLDYYSIWVVNKETMKINMLRSPSRKALEGAVSIPMEYSVNEAIEKYISNYVAPDDQERMRQKLTIENVFGHLQESDFYTINYMRNNSNSEVDYNQVAFANANTADGKQLVVFGFRDVNDILKQEQALRKEINDAKIAAEAANAAKTSFLFNMSHDIRTPMNAIIGFRDLLEKNQEDPEKRANYLEKIEESSTVLLSIINNVLEMARIEKGVLELDESVWSAEQMNDSIYSVFAEMMKQKDLEFTRELDVEHQFVYYDAIKTREIFYNIISNAYKYTNPGGKIHMKLQEIPSDKEGYAKYQTTISDTGIGMDKDFLPHIFEEFAREQNSTHSKIEGTGLGMPIVKRFVDFLGGTIEVESEKGVGSRFTVTLYHRIADKSMMKQVDAEVVDDSIEGKRILLVEDNELNAEIAMAVLSEIGLEVERVEDGQVCIERLQEVEADYYDLILMDIQMPRMNGYEATRAIRAMEDKEKSQIKILAMTANAFEEDKREAMKAGMNGHLAKPINVRELTKTLSNMLN